MTHSEKTSKDVFKEYFMLFENADDIKKNKKFMRQMGTSGNPPAAFEYVENNLPMFEDFDAFLNACFKKE